MAPRLGAEASVEEAAEGEVQVAMSAARFAPPPASNRWGITRAAPIVVVPRSGFDLSSLVRHRAAVQSGLLTLLVVAFAAIAISRMPSGQSTSGALLVPSATALATVTPPPATPAPTRAPVVTPAASVPVVVQPTTVQTPTLPPTPATYRVASGDTLSALAARWGTTVRSIMDLNSLTSTNLRVGQQLRIPTAAGTTPTAAG